MGFAAGFRVGWDSVSDALKERERKEMLAGVKAAMEAKPEQSTGFTAEQGKTLEDATKNGDAVTFDQAKNAYVITPAAGGEARMVAMQNVTDFLGNRTAGVMTDADISMARNRSVVDVLKRHDPERAFQLERDLARDGRDAQRFGWEQKDRQNEEARKKERQDLLAGGNIARVQEQNRKAQADYEQQTAQYQAQVGQGGNQSRLIAPSAPQLAKLTPAQMMEDYAKLIQVDAKYDKVSTEGLMQFAERFEKMESEGYTKVMKLAQSGAPLAQVIKAFNESGKSKSSVDDVVSDKMVAGADGVPARVLTFRDGTSINVLAELNALNQAQQVYDQFWKKKADTRADNADARAARTEQRNASEAAETKTEKKAKADAAVAVYKQNNPSATEAELEGVRRGVLEAVPKPKPYKMEMGDVASALGTPAVDASGKPITDVMTGRQVVNRNPQEEDKFFQWMKKNNITDTNEGLIKYKSQGAAAQPPLQNVTDADIKATAKKYGITEDQVKARLGLK